MKKVLVEAAGVAMIGAVIGLLANASSPKGLALSRNYFPRAISGGPAGAGPQQGSMAASTNTPSTPDLANRLAAAGFTLVDSNFVAKAFTDPRRGLHQLIFIDARQTSYYEQGHVPGAYQLDYYHPEPHLPVVLPAAQVAETVIIYCNGGNCEDSEFAAIFLRDAGIPAHRLHVYHGGFSEWAANGMPVEIGPKDSGVLKQP